ncbi:uncharacterized protein LOC106163185 [Lingula anatina]|uniref:Uncharacterized protein LOC106163185 n=1 Tax=Lingula anatina TaxID=7574 RepID=A0A1S3ID18_LINAN|nr:uncharacterized protein LOC106163185 [Lingula anatina]|eukprot:XP_013396155.1 uncharacterized protein LOC106163185 [Lingula anatina]
MAALQPSLDAASTKTRLKGRVAIVTGGAGGIGSACVRRFLNDGALVAFFDIDQVAGKQLEAELQAAGFETKFYQVDVSDREACFKAVSHVASQYGGCINFLVNCAAVFTYKALDADTSDWAQVMSVNVAGYSNMVQACFPHMKTAEPDARSVVNIASIFAHVSSASKWTYCTSKGAVLELTRCMALDLAKDDIRVNSVSPGSINTAAVAKFFAGDEDLKRWFEGCHMMNRIGESAEVAAAIAFLCSRDASFITGADLPVDGGYAAVGPERHGKDGAKFTGTMPE